MKTPVRPGCLVGGSHQLIGDAKNAAHVGAFAVHQLHLEAAGIADAGDRRRRNRDDEGFLDCLQAAVELSDDLGAPSARAPAGFRRCRRRRRRRRELEALVKVAPLKPAKATAFFTPGVLRMISEARSMTASVRDRAAPSGSCTTTMA